MTDKMRYPQRGLGLNSIWKYKRQYRQVVARTKTHVQWANLSSPQYDHHWQQIESWLKWVAKAKRVYL